MKPRIWTTVGDLRWLRPLELSHNFCRAISWNARLLYPTKAAVPTVRHRGSYGPKANIAPASHTAEDFATWGDQKQKPRNARGFS
jgi:hypothetical protein